MSVPPELAGRIQTGTWALIYVGMVCVGLGVAIERRGGSFGWPVCVAGGVLIVAGIALIVWRSRVRIDTPAARDDQRRP